MEKTGQQHTGQCQKIASVMKWRDIVIMVISVAVAAASAWAVYRKPIDTTNLIVNAPDGQYMYDLSKPQTVEIRGNIGVSVLEITDGTARFVTSPCDNKTCVAHGFLSGGYDFAACLPNGVMIMIEGTDDDGIDAVAQ